MSCCDGYSVSPCFTQVGSEDLVGGLSGHMTGTPWEPWRGTVASAGDTGTEVIWQEHIAGLGRWEGFSW